MATRDVNVRATAGGSLLRTVAAGTTGTVLDGPVVQSFGTCPNGKPYYYIWWKINWDDGGADGWSVEDALARISETLGVFRPSVGRWYLDTNQDGSTDVAVTYGTNGDIPVPGDYDGSEGLMDLAVFRPSIGRWFIDLNRDGSTDLSRQYGTNGDIPVPADYNGDGMTDVAVFRPLIGYWFIDWNRDGVTDRVIRYGTRGDIPVPADYTGDAITDLAVFRPSVGRWFIDTDQNGTTNISVVYGTGGDIPLPADYDGDGRADFALFRRSNGRWFIDINRNGTTDIAVTYGVSSDIPVPGDYNGDLMADIAVFRPSTGQWFLDTNRNGRTDRAVIFGTSSDIPLWENGWILTALKVVPLIFTNWLSSSEYQAEFDRQLINGFYPVAVEGRNQGGQSQFRGAFVPFPPGPFSFFSHHALTREVYDQRNAELLNQGYVRVWLQTFVDALSVERFQVTWVKE